jgi:DNA-directed RNA polymerase subunit K/omega
MRKDYIPLEALLPASNGSIYKLTILAAKRALSLADGAKPMIEKPSEKLLENVLAEIMEGKIRVKEDKEKK